MTISQRVLVVDDAEEVRTLLRALLADAGFDVRCAGDGASALAEVATWSPALVVLDVVLPDANGVDLCRTIRETSDALVLLVTARDTEADILDGLGAGADDYLTKPFSMRELVMRAFALLRRAPTTDASMTKAEQSDSTGTLTHGNLQVDVETRECTIDGDLVPLTKIEFDIVATLLRHPRSVVSRSQIIQAVWGDNWYGYERVVDVHLSNARKKLSAVESGTYFVAVRGVGYRLAPVPTNTTDAADTTDTADTAAACA